MAISSHEWSEDKNPHPNDVHPSGFRFLSRGPSTMSLVFLLVSFQNKKRPKFLSRSSGSSLLALLAQLAELLVEGVGGIEEVPAPLLLGDEL